MCGDRGFGWRRTCYGGRTSRTGDPDAIASTCTRQIRRVRRHESQHVKYFSAEDLRNRPTLGKRGSEHNDLRLRCARGPATGSGPSSMLAQHPCRSPHRREHSFDAVDDRYFPTLAVHIVEGRDFSAEDHSSSPKVTIVSQSFGHRDHRFLRCTPSIDVEAASRRELRASVPHVLQR